MQSECKGRLPSDTPRPHAPSRRHQGEADFSARAGGWGLAATGRPCTHSAPLVHTHPPSHPPSFLPPPQSGISVSTWASCLGALATGWRSRYGATIPFVAGTFTFTQQSYAALQCARARPRRVGLAAGLARALKSGPGCRCFRPAPPSPCQPPCLPSCARSHARRRSRTHPPPLLPTDIDFLRFNFGQGRYGAPNGSSPYYSVLTAATMPTLAGLPLLALADSYYLVPPPPAQPLLQPVPYDLAVNNNVQCAPGRGQRRMWY